VFTSRKKNCYFISVDKGPLLVRASFYYGNYDRKLSPPSFDLLIDGNHWTKVITSLDKLLYYEVVYVVESDATTICLAQTQPNQFPFISALEVRSLDPKMYSYVDPKYALFVRSRFAYGASATVRYIMIDTLAIVVLVFFPFRVTFYHVVLTICGYLSGIRMMFMIAFGFQKAVVLG
jgi:hypothetical protein